MRPYKVIVISPSVYSHHLVMLPLAKAFERSGCEVLVACNQTLQGSVESRGLTYYPLDLNGAGDFLHLPQSDQALTSEDRIEKLLKATQDSIVETLALQAEYRTEDGAFPAGKKIIANIMKLRDLETPDLWVVDQTSVIATLALHGMQEEFVSFCAAHPLSVPLKKGVVGMPSFWPKDMRPAKEALRALRKKAKGAHRRTTRRFNQLQRRINRELPKTIDALRFISPKAVLFNYPNFGNYDNRHLETHRVYMGASMMEETLSQSWHEKLSSVTKSTPKILISFGTFFSNRDDIVLQCIEAARSRFPESLIIATAGKNADKLQSLADERTIIECTIPQRALLPHIDLVVHHGGVGTFTESLYFAKPMVVMPFAGDQFSVAYDVQDQKLGQVVNPYSFTREELEQKMTLALTKTDEWLLHFWSQRIRQSGPDYAVAQLRLPVSNRYMTESKISA